MELNEHQLEILKHLAQKPLVVFDGGPPDSAVLSLVNKALVNETAVNPSEARYGITDAGREVLSFVVLASFFAAPPARA